MNLWELHKGFVNIRRFQEIAYVFAKHGFGDVLKTIGLEALSALGLSQSLLNRPSHHDSRPGRLRAALEELGPTFIKLGQILSTRADILGQEYVPELQKLQEQVTPLPNSTIAEVLKAGLQIESLDEVFAHFDYTPVATASIAQVHKARLHNSQAVIVKIQKPNMKETIRTDLDILSFFVKVLQEQMVLQESADWSVLIENFIEGILKELDFFREARMMSRFASVYNREDSKVLIPSVLFEFSGERILTMEYLPGIRINDTVQLNTLALPLSTLGEELVTNFFRQVFEQGLFHGDPHPGNLRIDPGGKIIFYDFGMVGQLDSKTLWNLTRMFYAAAQDDYALMSRSVHLICHGSIHGVDPMLEADLKDLVQTYKDLPLREVSLKYFLRALDQILLSHHLRLPAELSILLKAILTLESSVRILNPDIALLEFLLPQFRRLVHQQMEPKALWLKLQGALHLGLDYASELHSDLFTFVKQQKQIQQETLQRFRRTEITIYRFEKLIYRAILGLIVSSALIGSSILIAAGKDTALPYYFGVFGWFCAFVFAAIMIYNIITGRKPGSD